MTPRNNETPTTEGLLEDILTRMESIDRNVEEILDHLTDHFAAMQYSAWSDDNHNGEKTYE